MAVGVRCQVFLMTALNRLTLPNPAAEATVDKRQRRGVEQLFRQM